MSFRELIRKLSRGPVSESEREADEKSIKYLQAVAMQRVSQIENYTRIDVIDAIQAEMDGNGPRGVFADEFYDKLSREKRKITRGVQYA